MSSWNFWNFLNSCTTGSFSRRIQICGVSLSICEKTTTLIFLTLSWYTTLLTETCNIILVQLPRQSNASPLTVLVLLSVLFLVKLLLFSSSSSSYIAADNQSASSSCCRASVGAHDQILIFFVWQLCSFFFMLATSLTRGRVCRLSVKVCIFKSFVSTYISIYISDV
jgi:hypothetical protein